MAETEVWEELGNGRVVKIGDPAKADFVKEAKGVFLGFHPGQYKNDLYDFMALDGKITVPGSATIASRLGSTEKGGGPQEVGRLVKLVYEGEVASKKSNPTKMVRVYVHRGTLPPEYAALVPHLVAEVERTADTFAEVPAALTEKDDDESLPF